MDERYGSALSPGSKTPPARRSGAGSRRSGPILRIQSPSRLRWYLYDAGNTIVELAVSLNLFAFFAASGHLTNRDVGLVYAVSTWVATGLGFALGSHIDRTGNAIGALRILTVASAILISALSLVPREAGALLLVCAALGNLTFILGALAYTSMMKGVSRGTSVLSVSGRGVAASYVGSLAAIVVWLLVMRRISDRAALAYVFLYSGILYLAFSLPLLREKAPRRRTRPRNGPILSRRYIVFLAGAMLITAALHGTALNLIPFLEGRGLPEPVAQRIWAFGALTVIVGAAAVGVLGRTIRRNPRRWLAGSIAVWALAVGTLSLDSGLAGVVSAVGVAGACAGWILSTVRGQFAAVTSLARQGIGFGTFFLFQRMGQGLGPVGWTLADNREVVSGFTGAPLLMAAVGVAAALMFLVRAK
jgi:MFS-type transporter involved in bile tolerance (Atg22 family)